MPRVNPNLLLVEGKNDQHVVYALRDRHGIPNCFEVFAHDGIDPLLEALPERLRESDRERIGVVVDADTSVGGRWDALRRILANAGYAALPQFPDSVGTIVPSADAFLPQVGIWIMPDNQGAGMLEHFLQFLVPAGDMLLPRALRTVAEIPLPERRFPEEHRAKAEIHTWLAWQEQPGQPYGTSITTRYLDGDRPQARQFADWMRRLFDVPAPPFP